MNLLSYLRKKAIDRRIKEFRTTSEYKTWRDVESVLLVFESDMDENGDVRELMRGLQEEGKRVSACMYVDVKESPTMSRDNYVVLDRKGVGLMGSYASETARRVVRGERFDVVIDLTTRLVYPLMHFVMDVNAGMRCGKAKEELRESPYDMQMEMTEMGDERMEIYNQIVRYLKMIKG